MISNQPCWRLSVIIESDSDLVGHRFSWNIKCLWSKHRTFWIRSLLYLKKEFYWCEAFNCLLLQVKNYIQVRFIWEGSKMVETEGKSQKELNIKSILVHLWLAHTPHDSRLESWFNSVYHGSLHMTTIHLEELNLGLIPFNHGLILLTTGHWTWEQPTSRN